MQWFKIPDKIYFEEGTISYLEKIPNISRVFIVTDEAMAKLGCVDKVLYHLRKREEGVHSEIFADIDANPSLDTIYKGLSLLKEFNPDTIIALGGNAIDAAKGMWLFYEQPEASIEGLKLKFIDIRKRTYKFPKIGTKAKLIAIPTISGSGTEITPFAMITDKVQNMKYTLADYELTPDIVIIDPDLVMSMPKRAIADTGMDILTHALEAYVSNIASDYTDGLAEKAVQLIFKYLLQAYEDETDKEAREKIHNASTIAGMAYANAFLGLNHSIAHKLAGEFGISHGRANAILLPYVIRYNATPPEKSVYEDYKADYKYAEIARRMGWDAVTDEEGVNSLIQHIDMLAERAFEDQCTTTNPRLPLISEIKDILLQAYYG